MVRPLTVPVALKPEVGVILNSELPLDESVWLEVNPPFNVREVVVLAPLPVTDARVSASVPVTVIVEPTAETLLIPAPTMVSPPVSVFKEVTPALFKVMLDPRETEPPPDKPLPAVTVTDEFARLALEMAAVPERLALVIPEMVFEAAEIVLLVKVSVVALPTSVSVASGKVRVLEVVVGDQVSVPVVVVPKTN